MAAILSGTIFRRVFFATLSAMLLAVALPAVASEEYVTRGDCDGFPKLQLSTAPGLCVGLVASRLGFVRGITTLGDAVYVTDMVGWKATGKGRLLRIDISHHTPPQVVLTGMDAPNSLVNSGHGTMYIGEMGKVIEYDPRIADAAKATRDVVVGLPTKGLHPLSAIVMGTDGSLFINVGSATNNCEKEDETPGENPCQETTENPPRGTILHIMPKPDRAVDAKDAQIVARGLRNSMALAMLPKGQLIAAVNSRDAIDQVDSTLSDEALPHDTLNWIKTSADYGWPYCYDNNRASPEYPHFNCNIKQPPTKLLPPHAAPLGMLFYDHTAIPELTGHLIIPYHGYRAPGHRIVKLLLDEDGQPKGEPIDIVWDWNAKPGQQPMGAPVGITMLPDGSLLVTEDHNGTLLRIAKASQ
jgi:glucose/arabinose dehydrogenase